MRFWSWIRTNAAPLAVVVPVGLSALGGAWYVGSTVATKDDVAALNAAVTHSAETLGNLQGTVGVLSDAVGSLQQTVGDLGGTVGDLQGTVGDLQGTVNALGDLRGTVGDLQGTVGDPQGTVNALSGAVAAVDDLRVSVDEVRDAIPNLVACIIELHRDQSLDFREPGIPEICEQMRARARGAR